MAGVADRIEVIGLAGRAGAGKDTAASGLVAMRGFRRIALADGVKSAFDDLSGPTREAHKAVPSIRRAWQLLGTEHREAAGAPGLWVHLLIAKASYAHAELGWRRFVVPDLRFPMEASMLWHWCESRGHAFRCYRVDRPDLGPIAEGGHASERLVDSVPVDDVLVNAGTPWRLAELAVARFDCDF